MTIANKCRLLNLYKTDFITNFHMSVRVFRRSYKSSRYLELIFDDIRVSHHIAGI
jgi:hypothetical protein